MNPYIKKRWVEALRSGKYKQGIGRLKFETPEGKIRHCCLGVLSELALQDGVVQELKSEIGLPLNIRSEYMFGDLDQQLSWNYGTLCSAIMEWAGLSEEDPTVISNPDDVYNPFNSSSTLSELNDGGSNFNEIADYIENQL